VSTFLGVMKPSRGVIRIDDACEPFFEGARTRVVSCSAYPRAARRFVPSEPPDGDVEICRQFLNCADVRKRQSGRQRFEYALSLTHSIDLILDLAEDA
jgi:hypothetical protein